MHKLSNLVMSWFEFMSWVHAKIKVANLKVWKYFGVRTMRLYKRLKGDNDGNS